MKKIYGLFAIVCLLALISTPVMAATQTVAWDAAEADRIITDDTGGGSGLTNIGLSPNVDIFYDSDGTYFEIAGYNDKGKFEYGVCADDNNVYMLDMDPTGEGTIEPVTTVGTVDAPVVTGWTLMGGAAAAAAAAP